jgi:hypothetical protein
LEERYWSAVHDREGRLTVNVKPMFEAIAAELVYRVVPLTGQSLLLGLLASRLKTAFEVPSGSALNCPADLKPNQQLSAIYPAAEDPGIPKLDHEGSSVALSLTET